jgi:uncharacterized membrane protein
MSDYSKVHTTIGIEPSMQIFVDRSQSGYTTLNSNFPHLKSTACKYDIENEDLFHINVLVD